MNKRILIGLPALLGLVFVIAAHAEQAPAPAAAEKPRIPLQTAEAAAKGSEKSPGYAHEQRADEQFKARNVPDALKELDAAIAKDPKSATAHVKKAVVLYSTGKPLEAIPLLDKAMELNKGDKIWAWWPLYHKGIALGIKGDIAEALKNFDESIKLNPAYENHFGRATAYLYQQKWDESRADAKIALQYKPDDASIPRFISQLEARAAGTKFLDEMAAKKGAQKTASGLVYFDLKKGSGNSPAATDTVKVHYHGTLPDGTVFDSSVERKEPATFPLSGVIPCWTEGVQKMKVGGKASLICPAAIAYGNRSPSPQIPPGATLVFEVELLAIEKQDLAPKL
jgi:FKBP-type peptidyl-prolyl cis-trans isomerase